MNLNKEEWKVGKYVSEANILLSPTPSHRQNG
jgi:hypothetical protein